MIYSVAGWKPSYRQHLHQNPTHSYGHMVVSSYGLSKLKSNVLVQVKPTHFAQIMAKRLSHISLTLSIFNVVFPNFWKPV